jgi:hypothetical protein
VKLFHSFTETVKLFLSFTETCCRLLSERVIFYPCYRRNYVLFIHRKFSINNMLQVAHREGDTRTVMLEGYEGEEQVGGAGPSEMPLLDSKVN